MASHSVTIQLKSSTTWSDLKYEVDAEGVPDTARVSVHVDSGYSQLDPGCEELIEELIFEWGNR